VVGEVWDDELTVALARAVVEVASPAELMVFDLIAAGRRTSPARSDERGDGAIGFGADIVTAAVAAIPVATAVGVVLETAGVELVKMGVVSGFKSLMSRRIRGEDAGPDVLPPDVVTRARDAAREQAQLLGMPPDEAALLGNAVAGVLAARS